MPPDQEVELKFLCDSAALHALPDDPSLAGAQPKGSEQIVTQYFDTPDHDLKTRGISCACGTPAIG